MYNEVDLLPLHYLNDLLFCERRAALHLIEKVWTDNRYTTEGTLAHKRVDLAALHRRGSRDDVTAMTLVSYRIGLVGKTDLVEFHAGQNGLKVPYPVDFKRGRKRRWNNNEVQLCAQALCLEEMLDVHIPCGAIFHVQSKARQEVVFDLPLRKLTEDAARRLHELVRSDLTPPARFKPRCKGCSLFDTCQPKAVRSRFAAGVYLQGLTQAVDNPDLARDQL